MDSNDPDYKPEVEKEGAAKSVDYTEVITFGERFQLSSFVVASMINLVVKALDINDSTKQISLAGVQNLRKRVRKQALENHSAKMKNLLCIKFDEKTSWEALLYGQEDKAHLVTCIEEPGGSFLDFYKVPNESGEALSNGLIKIIEETESEDSLVACGTGNLLFKNFPFNKSLD